MMWRFAQDKATNGLVLAQNPHPRLVLCKDLFFPLAPPLPRSFCKPHIISQPYTHLDGLNFPQHIRSFAHSSRFRRVFVTRDPHCEHSLAPLGKYLGGPNLIFSTLSFLADLADFGCAFAFTQLVHPILSSVKFCFGVEHVFHYSWHQPSGSELYPTSWIPQPSSLAKLIKCVGNRREVKRDFGGNKLNVERYNLLLESQQMSYQEQRHSSAVNDVVRQIVEYGGLWPEYGSKAKLPYAV
ncbi:hypothetical protein KCU81_g778, partial [Aureobasidium melanogenum]